MSDRKRAREPAKDFVERANPVGWFEAAGLSHESWEDFMDAEMPPVRRFRACYKLR
jgi:hypothetical protein